MIFQARNAFIRSCSSLPRHVNTSPETPAVTGYEVLGKKDNLVALRCKLYSGKTHQIRVHLKDVLGVEIVNDLKYGKRTNNLKNIKLDKKTMYLHCQRICLRYNGKDMMVLF